MVAAGVVWVGTLSCWGDTSYSEAEMLPWILDTVFSDGVPSSFVLRFVGWYC